MDPIVLATLVFITFLILGFLTWFTVHKSKEKERLLLLEKGMNPSELPGQTMFSFPWLKLGCVITSAVIGLTLGIVLESLDFFDAAQGIGMLLFGGIGLIIAHYLDKPSAET
jgi:hypothetical protein